MTDSKIHQWTETLLGPQADPVAAGTALQQLAQSPANVLPAVIQALADNTEAVAHSDPAIMAALALAVQRLATGNFGTLEDAETQTEQAIRALKPEWVADVVMAFPPEAANRFRLMYLLTMQRSPESLRALTQLLCDRPPQHWSEVGQIISPLMQQDDWDADALFPDVLDALIHRPVAAPVLDLANYLYRKGRVTQHPGSVRESMLSQLLGGVADRLGQFEENPRTFGNSVDEVQTVLAEAVAIAVSLCDALGLISSEQSTPQLYKAMELKHRRVQCEAAGALAKLGVEEGRNRLIALAAEPSARLRVIAYADELGFGDEIANEYRTEVARAEAEVALWLSQPEQMGVPPTNVEVIDSRLQYWPSYERPLDCYLVRFEYAFGERAFSNVAIAGPVVHAVAADVGNLAVDDIYALYAGWHAEHPEIFRVPVEQWNAAQKRLAEPLTDHLDRQGFESVKPVALGFFLDEHALITIGSRDSTACVIVTDGLETIDFATEGRLRPMGPDDVWHLFLGRKMLRTFNR